MLGAGALGLALAACGGGTVTRTVTVTASPPTTPAAATAPAASPTPGPATASPNGTYQGACSYTLGDNPSGAAVATGDVEVTNTGNIGTVVTVSITWPQQGYSPLKQVKTRIRVAVGATNDVQFDMPLTGTQLDNLQNWQTGHPSNDGCTYNATITNTYGAVKG